jgi:hypothetical protein
LHDHTNVRSDLRRLVPCCRRCRFVPRLVHEATPHQDLTITDGYGHLLGLFPVNLVHNLVHVLFGVWGVLAWRAGAGGAMSYARGVAISYAVLLVFGLIPTLNVLFGLAPLYGNDVWLHALLALVAAYFGWMHRDRSALA